MFEKYVSNILVRALSQYAEDIDATQLQLKIFSGKASLNDLKLKPSVFNDLGLPFKMSRGICKRINITIPVTNLQSKPCVADIEDMYVMLYSPTDEVFTEETYKVAIQQAKERIVAAYEEEKKKRAEKKDDENGFVSRLTEVIINNVIINVKNVHIRFERPNQGTIFGAILQSVNVKTTDEQGRDTFINPHESIKVNKRLTFSGLQLYAEPLAQSAAKDTSRYVSLIKGIEEWQKGMLKRVSEGEKVNSTIFGPVDGDVIAEVMFQQHIGKHKDRPYATLRVDLKNFVAKLSRPQYLCLLDIADQATNSGLMAAIQHFRPAMPENDILKHKGPRGTNAAARTWWRYAARAVNEVGFYKHCRELRSRFLMPRYAQLYTKSVISEIIKGNEALVKIPQYSVRVMSPAEEKSLAFVYERMQGADVVQCRYASQQTISKSVDEIKAKIAELKADRSAEKKSSWFSWGKSDADKNDEQMLAELEKEWGIDGPEQTVAVTELPPSYQWLNLNISLGVGGVHLNLNERESVKMNLTSIAIGSKVFNAATKDSTAFSITAEDWTVTNPDEKTKAEIPYLISRFGSSADFQSIGGASGSLSSISLSSRKPFMVIGGASKPIDSPVDFKFKMALEPLMVLADPSFLTRMGYFFVIPPSLDLTSLSHKTQGYVNSAAAQASEAATAAVNDAKTIDADIDIQAPVAIIPQGISYFDGPCLVVSLGRLRFKASPLSEAARKERMLLAKRSDLTGEQMAMVEELHYYCNTAELSELYVTCSKFRLALKDAKEGFPIIPQIHLSANVMLRSNGFDKTRPTIVVSCKSDALRFCFSTHTAFLITSMTSTWAINTVKSVKDIEETNRLYSPTKSIVIDMESSSKNVLNIVAAEQKQLETAVQLAQADTKPRKEEPTGPFFKSRVEVQQFSLELFDDNGVLAIMKDDLKTSPEAFLGDKKLPPIVPARKSISNHPVFIVRTSPFLLTTDLDDAGELIVGAYLTNIEGLLNELSGPSGGAYNVQTITSAKTVLGGGATLSVDARLPPVPKGSTKKPPMEVSVSIDPVIDLHLSTPLFLLLESAMDAINMLTGVVDDVEASSQSPSSPSGSVAVASPKEGAASPKAAAPVEDEPKILVKFRSKGLKAIVYNNYYYTNKEVKRAQDTVGEAEAELIKKGLAASSKARQQLKDASGMAVDNVATFDHIRASEDYIFATAAVELLEVTIVLNTKSMDVNGSLDSFTVAVTDPSLPPMYRTVITPVAAAEGSRGSAMLVFAFNKRPTEYPIVFENSDDGNRRVLRDAANFQPSSYVQATIEPSRLVYDQPTIMSLLDWATSGFLSRLPAVSMRPRYDGKFMIPPPPVPKKVMQLSIEVREPKAIVPCNPRKGRQPGVPNAKTDSDADYAGSNDHLEAELEAVAIRSELSVADLTQTIKIELSSFTVKDTKAKQQAKTDSTVIPKVGINIYLTNSLDPNSLAPQLVLVRIPDPLQLLTTTQSITRVLTLFTHNVLNLTAVGSPPVPAALLEGRRKELQQVGGGKVASPLSAAAAAKSAPPSKPTIVDILVGSIQLLCRSADSSPLFDITLDTLKVQLLPDQKKIEWSSLFVSDARSHSQSAKVSKLLVCKQSKILLKDSFEEHDEGAQHSYVSDVNNWFVEEKCSCWEDKSEAGITSAKVQEWLPDACLIEGKPIDTKVNKGTSVFAIEIDFEIERFALTAQWLSVYDYLLNEANMAALAALSAPKDDELQDVTPQSNDSRMSLTLTSRTFVVPLLSNKSEELFTANLDSLSVAFSATTGSGQAIKLIHVSVGNVSLTHSLTGRQIISSNAKSLDSPLLDISLLIANNSTIIAVFLKELVAYTSMPILNQLIYYASDPSQPIAQISQLGVMKEERARLAALAAEQAKKGTLHLGLRWASPTLLVPCDTRDDAAIVNGAASTAVKVHSQTISVRLGDLTTVYDLVNTNADIQPVTITRKVDELSLVLSEPATKFPTVSGQRSDTKIKVMLERMSVEGLLEDTGIFVDLNRTAWTPLPAAAARYLQENPSDERLHAPPSTNTISVQLSPTSVTASHRSLIDTSNALFFNIMLPNEVAGSQAVKSDEGSPKSPADEVPTMPLCPTPISAITFSNESLSAKLYDTANKHFSSFELKGIYASLGGDSEEDVDRLEAHVTLMEAKEFVSNHKFLSTKTAKDAIRVSRLRKADNLIVTSVGVSGVYFVVVPKVLGSVIDLALTPLSEVSQVQKKIEVSEEGAAAAVKSRSMFEVSLESFAVELLQAGAGTEAKSIASLAIDTSTVRMEDGKVTKLSEITGTDENDCEVTSSEVSVSLGKIEILNKTTARANSTSSGPQSVNPIFNTLVQQRSDFGSVSEFVSVRMVTLKKGPKRPDGSAYFAVDSFLDVHVGSLEFILVPAVVAELGSALNEASQTITNAAKARNRASAAAADFMTEVSPNIMRMRVIMDNPMVSVAPTPFYADTLQLSPGSFRIESILSDAVHSAGGEVQWSAISVSITGMTTKLLGVEMLSHSEPMNVKYASALKAPTYKEAVVDSSIVGKNDVDDKAVIYDTKIGATIPNLGITLSEQQMLFLFRGLYEYKEVQAQISQRSEAEAAATSAPTSGTTENSTSKAAPPKKHSTMKIDVEVGVVAVSALTLFEAHIGEINFTQATTSSTISYYKASVGELYVTHALWPHLEPTVRRDLRSLSDSNVNWNRSLLTSPSLTVVLFRQFDARSTTVISPEDAQTITETQADLSDGELAVSPDFLQDIMERVYKPMNQELFRTSLIPEPALLLDHTSSVTIDSDITLTPMKYLHVAGDDICVYVLDLGGNTLFLTGIEPTAQIALAEDVHLTIKNGTINIPGLYSLESYVHFSAGSKIVIDRKTVDINQKLWRLSGSHAVKLIDAEHEHSRDERVINLTRANFELGVQLITTHQALKRYLTSISTGLHSSLDELSATEAGQLQSMAAKALVSTAQPLRCSEVGLMVGGRFQMNQAVNPQSGKPLTQTIDLQLKSLQSFDGKLLRKTEAQVQMIGVGNVQISADIKSIECMLVVEELNKIILLATQVMNAANTKLDPLQGEQAQSGIPDTAIKARVSDLEVRKSCLGSAQTVPLLPRQFQTSVQMKDEETGRQYVFRQIPGTCKNCQEHGHATLSISGLGDPRVGTICTACAFGKASFAFSGGECGIKKVDALLVGKGGEMVEFVLTDFVLKKKGEEIMVDAQSGSKASSSAAKGKEGTSEMRTTLSADFFSTVYIFNTNFTTWEPVLESLNFKVRGWTEENIWHIAFPKKTEATISQFALSTFSVLATQFTSSSSELASQRSSEINRSLDAATTPLTSTTASHTKRLTQHGNASSEFIARDGAVALEVRVVNYLNEEVSIEEAKKANKLHAVQSRNASEFQVEGTDCVILHQDRRLKISLDQHAYFTMADIVVEVTMDVYTDTVLKSEQKRTIVRILPVHKSGSIIRIVSRVPCAMYSQQLGLLKPNDEMYVHSGLPLINPFIMEPRDIEGGPYAPTETVGTTVPSLRNVLNGASPLLVSKSLQTISKGGLSLSFRIHAESDGTICGAPRFTISIDGGRSITNNVLIPLTVDLLSGSLKIHTVTLPPLITRQIIFNSDSALHFKFTCIQEVKNSANDDAQAIALRAASKGEVIADEAEGRYSSSAVVLKRGDHRISLMNLMQNIMLLQCTVNYACNEITLSTPFAITNHTPLPLRLVEKSKPNQRMSNWEFLPAGMSTSIPVVPSEEQETPALMAKVQALGHYETRDFVPLQAVETVGQIELLTVSDKTSIQLSYYTIITASGCMLITIVPRWVIVNRTPWTLNANQYSSVDLQPIGMPPQSAHHCYRMQRPASSHPHQLCIVDPSQQMERTEYNGLSEAMPFSIEELGDFHVTLPGSHHKGSPDRQLKISVFPDGPRMFVIIESVASSAYLLLNRTNVPVAFSKPTCPSITKQTIDAETTKVLSAKDVIKDQTRDQKGRVLVFAAPSEVRSFGLNGNSANKVLQCVVISIGATIDGDGNKIRDNTCSFLIPLQNPDGSVPSPDAPIHLMDTIACRISQGSMGRTIVEIVAIDTSPATTSTSTQRILLPPRPTSLDVGLNISYFSISLVDQPHEVLFGVFADVRARVQRTTEFETYSFSILNFQFDNQSERKPPYEGCFFAIRPNNEQAAVQGFLQRRVLPGRTVACFTSVRLDLMPIALRMSDVLLYRLREFAGGITSGPNAEEAAMAAIDAAHAYRNRDNLYSSAPIAVGRDAMMVTIERMIINPIHVRLWFSRQRSDAKQDIIRSSQNVFLSYLVMSCEDVTIRIPGLTVQSQTGQARGMVAKFKNFYLDGLRSQLFAVLFQYVSAIPLIGAPVKLVSDIGLGTFRVFQDRIDDLTTSPEAFALGVARGTVLVVGNVIGGSLNLVGMVADSGAKLVNLASGDSGKKMNTATGFFHGLTGIVTKPMHGAAEGGAAGFFKGLGQGVVGVATNPIAGLLGDLSKATTLVGSVFTDKYIPEVKRLRPIRLFLPGGAIAPIDCVVEVFQFQRKYAGDHFWTNNLLPTDGSNWKPRKREEVEKEFKQRPDAWIIDRRKGTTFDGWTYDVAISGGFQLNPEEVVHLRRRRWVIVLSEVKLSPVLPPLQSVEISCPVDNDDSAFASPSASIASPSAGNMSNSSMALKANVMGTRYVSTKGDEAETVKVIDIFENQRYYPVVGWRSKMLPTDRGVWSDRQGHKMESTDSFHIPDGWVWEDTWHLVGGGKEGWEYALDFPHTFNVKSAVTDCVRRRLWRRTMKQK